MAIGKTLKNIDMSEFTGGCNYTNDILAVAPNESPNAMNVIFFDNKLECRPGYDVLYSDSLTGTTHSIGLYGVNNYEKDIIAHIGTTVYRMANFSGTLITLRESAPNTRSRKSVVKQSYIQTYDDYSSPYYWNGVDATMSELSASAPGFKHAVEHQGYLLGANIDDNKLRIYYEDINTMVGGDFTSYFTLTGGKDEYITGFFFINGRLYCSTNTTIFRLSYIGGTAVFQYKEVVSNIGAVEDTVKTVTTDEFGQVCIFLGYNSRVYIFDGSFVRDISKKYYEPNNDTDIALKYLSTVHIDNSYAEYDTLENVYRLFVTKKGDEENYYCININVNNFSYYPFDNMPFNSVTMAEDSDGNKYLIGGDYSGKLYKLFTPTNTDNGTAIREYYEFPMLQADVQNIRKARSIDMYFNPSANYSLILEQRVQFTKTWTEIARLPMYDVKDKFLGSARLGTSAKLGSDMEVVRHSVNVPSTHNNVRLRLRREDDGVDVCSYDTGTVSGTGGSTSITGTGTSWDSSYMTADNGYKIWIKTGNHASETYDFTATSATAATVDTMESGDFTDSDYQVFRTGCPACMRKWELLKADFITEVLATGKGGAYR